MSLLSITRNKQYQAFNKLSTIAMAVLTRNLIKKGWKSITKNDPPQNPSDPSVPWREALIWGAATGLSVGISKVIMRRFVDLSWEKYKGPKPLNA